MPPVRAPDNITEHRLTLGKFERAQLTKATSTERQNVWLDAIPNIAIGAASLGVGMAGYGAYMWFTDDDGLINKLAGQISGLLTATGVIQYDAVELGKLIMANNAKQQIYRDIMLATNPRPSTRAYQAAEKELMRLVDEDDMLRIKLNDIATGKTTGYSWSLPCVWSWLALKRPSPVCFD